MSIWILELKSGLEQFNFYSEFGFKPYAVFGQFLADKRLILFGYCSSVFLIVC